MNTTNEMYQKAFEYLARGYSVIPLRRNKTPLLKENIVYQRERRPSDEEIEKWFLKKSNVPNIGICTGKISGITVVDIDTGGDAVTSLEAFPETLTIETPTGGYHLYYQYTDAIGQSANQYPQFPHVDIRNDGGYVVAPPSFCDYQKNKKRIAGAYKVVKQLPVAPFPVELFEKKKSTKPSASIDEVIKNMDTMADGDGRNVVLTKVVGKILQISNDDAISLTMALGANQQFKDPLPKKEVETIFQSIAKRENAKNIPEKDLDLLIDAKGNRIVNEENVYRVIGYDVTTKDAFRFNTFTGLVESKYGREDFTSFQREDINLLRMYLQRTYKFLRRVGYSIVEDAVLRLAHEKAVSPPAEYIKSIVWDKKPRLDQWLSKVYHVEDNEYHQKVGSNWMKGLVKRLIQPGCKFDYVIVFEGEQGTKKSTSLAVLGGPWHVETVFAPDNKDFFMLLSGNAIVEFSEGETLSRSESKRLKAVITMTNDKYRMPYDRTVKEFPRQCVFAMTTNQDEYLKDETGNRRWLPVACKGTADVEWLAENRDQLFAEAYHRVITLQETTWEFPEEETKRQQQARQTSDPREDLIAKWYFLKLTDEERNQGITVRDAYVGGVCDGAVLGKEMNKLDQTIIAGILKTSLKLEKQRVMNSGIREYTYFPSMETKKMIPTNLTEKQLQEIEISNLFKK